ncbi:SDR family oxidoreductase [Amycolatopsis acidicola]|uniref:SDR family oxidoreductase n=1 Tax=Amycolatopsis acidicola TaxID=2596893 RepID=A0A5N0UUM6_9PSEU|nr:SDR family oxidoreductase [Amycolatopsis acidicola]KAA9153455.1 SDR family oxidoreductase [Amycolatopsis acidicola]
MTGLLHPDLLRGRNVFVSGGGSGVNLAIARECAAVGANIAICGRTEAKLQAAVRELAEYGVKTSYAVADVRDEAAVAAAFDHAATEIGPMDGIVCGAAGNFLAPAQKISTNGFRAVTDIDLLGSFHCAKAGFEQVKQTGGALLFVSGGQSRMPFLHQAHVSAAKAGVDQLMRTLALEWGPLGIRSNSLVPGPVEGTEGMRRLTETADGDVWEGMVPLGRFARQDEVGRMAAVLLSPIASFVNGARIVVDGGMAMSGSAGFNAAVLSADS